MAMMKLLENGVMKNGVIQLKKNIQKLHVKKNQNQKDVIKREETMKKMLKMEETMKYLYINNHQQEWENGYDEATGEWCYEEWCYPTEEEYNEAAGADKDDEPVEEDAEDEGDDEVFSY